MMSKVDSQLSIQQDKNGASISRSIASLPKHETNRSLPMKQYNSTTVTRDMAKSKSSIKPGSSLIDLSEQKESMDKDFSYDVAFSTSNYQLVRNRNLFGQGDSI